MDLHGRPYPATAGPGGAFHGLVVTREYVAYDLHPEGDRLVAAQTVTTATVSEGGATEPQRDLSSSRTSSRSFASGWAINMKVLVSRNC